MFCESVESILFDVDVFDLLLLDDVALVENLDSILTMDLAVSPRVRPKWKSLTPFLTILDTGLPF
jgi:hypothetical protein